MHSSIARKLDAVNDILSRMPTAPNNTASSETSSSFDGPHSARGPPSVVKPPPRDSYESGSQTPRLPAVFQRSLPRDRDTSAAKSRVPQQPSPRHAKGNALRDTSVSARALRPPADPHRNLQEGQHPEFKVDVSDPLVMLRECIKYFISHPKRFGPVATLLQEEYGYVVSMWCAIREEDDADETQFVDMRVNGAAAAANIHKIKVKHSEELFVKDNYFDAIVMNERLAAAEREKERAAQKVHKKNLAAALAPSLPPIGRDAGHQRIHSELPSVPETRRQSIGSHDDTAPPSASASGSPVAPQQPAPDAADEQSKKKDAVVPVEDKNRTALSSSDSSVVPGGFSDYSTMREVSMLRKKLKHHENLAEHLRSQVEVLRMEVATKETDIAKYQSLLKKADLLEMQHRKEVTDMEAIITKLKKELAESINGRIKETGVAQKADAVVEKRLRDSKMEITQLYKHLKASEHRNMSLEREIDNAHMDRDEFSVKLMATAETLATVGKSLRARESQIQYLTRKLELKRGKILQLSGTINELEVFAGATTMVDRMAGEHPAWGVLFFIRTHQKHFESSAFFTPGHPFAASSLTTATFLKAREALMAEASREADPPLPTAEDTTSHQRRSDGVVFHLHPALQALPVATVTTSLLTPLPLPPSPTAEEASQLTELEKKQKAASSMGAGAKKTADQAVEALRNVIGKRPVVLRGISVKNAKLTRAEMRAVLTGFWKVRLDAFVEHRRREVEYEVLLEAHRVTAKRHSASQNSGDASTQSGNEGSVRDGSRARVVVMAEPTSPVKPPTNRRKSMAAAALQPSVSEDPPVKPPPAPTFLTVLVDHLNRCFPGTSVGSVPVPQSKRSGAQGNDNDSAPPPPHPGPGFYESMRSRGTILMEDDSYVVFTAHPQYVFPKPSADTAFLHSAAPGAGKHDAQVKVASVLTPGAMEMLAALVLAATEQCATDADAQLFHLVSNQLAPEQLAINFYLSLRGMFTACEETLFEAAVPSGDSELKDGVLTPTLSREGSVVENMGGSLSVRPGKNRRLSPGVGALNPTYLAQQVDSDGEEKDPDFDAIVEQELRAEAQESAMQGDTDVVEAGHVGLQAVLGEIKDPDMREARAKRQAEQQEKFAQDTMRRKSRVIMGAAEATTQSKMRSGRVTQTGMITLAAFLDIVANHFGASYDLLGTLESETPLYNFAASADASASAVSTRIVMVRRPKDVAPIVLARVRLAVGMDQASSVVRYAELFETDSSGRPTFFYTELLRATMETFMDHQRSLIDAAVATAEPTSLTHSTGSNLTKSASFSPAASRSQSPGLNVSASSGKVDKSVAAAAPTPQVVNIGDFRKMWLKADPDLSAEAVDEALTHLLYGTDTSSEASSPTGSAAAAAAARRHAPAIRFFSDFSQFHDVVIPLKESQALEIVEDLQDVQSHGSGLPSILSPKAQNALFDVAPSPARRQSQARSPQRSGRTTIRHLPFGKPHGPLSRSNSIDASAQDDASPFPGYFPLDLLVARLQLLFRHKGAAVVLPSAVRREHVGDFFAVPRKEVEQFAASVTATPFSVKKGMGTPQSTTSSAGSNMPRGRPPVEVPPDIARVLRLHEEVDELHGSLAQKAALCDRDSRAHLGLDNPVSAAFFEAQQAAEEAKSSNASSQETSQVNPGEGGTNRRANANRKMSNLAASLSMSQRKDRGDNKTGEVSLRPAAEPAMPVNLAQGAQTMRMRVMPLDIALHTQAKRKLGLKVAKCLPSDTHHEYIAWITARVQAAQRTMQSPANSRRASMFPADLGNPFGTDELTGAAGGGDPNESSVTEGRFEIPAFRLRGLSFGGTLTLDEKTPKGNASRRSITAASIDRK